MKKIFNRMNKSVIAWCLILTFILSLTSCTPYKKEQILCEYDELGCLYYVKDEYKDYKYSDYIMDDISNGLYKKSTPNIADYKNGAGVLDYDIPGYVQARMDYAIKKELIQKYELSVEEICMRVRDDYFHQRNAYIYYYDKNTKKSKLLYDGLVTNITYDDETPMITFDVDESNSELDDNLEGRRIMLSDIIAANSTIDGFMRVLLGTGKTKYKFFMDRRIDNDDLYNGIIASSSIIE